MKRRIEHRGTGRRGLMHCGTGVRGAGIAGLIAAAVVALATLVGCSSTPAGAPAATTTPAQATTAESAAPTQSAAPGAPAAPSNPTIILATTTSTQDSGLLDVLIPAFEQATGYTVKTVAVGTGQALAMGAQGNADVLLVHAPAQEEKFVADGNGVDRLLVMHNHFMIVGPKDDPAGIASGLTAAQAFAKIAQSGSAFVSRGDGSGTETKELAIWKVDNITPKGQSWYIQSGQGMGTTLQIAAQKKAYTLSDDATFLANQANLDLASLVQRDPVLRNIYHVISVNPAKFPKVNAAGAKAFLDYVTGTAGQAIIAGYGVDKFGQPLFTADAGLSDDSLQ